MGDQSGLTVLVCATCGGRLIGRVCVNGHNAYGGRRIEVVPTELVRDLKEAIKPILAAYNSDTGHITEEQITEAWAAYDAIDLAVPQEGEQP